MDEWMGKLIRSMKVGRILRSFGWLNYFDFRRFDGTAVEMLTYRRVILGREG